ncbi:MAG: putative zinc-binding peptidase [Proteobacteria bacterium]|nr:putative zinc-binding peptidase [Pseudomonadota bacterium]
MTPFACSRCQQTVFFENHQCGNCGARLGFVPGLLRLLAWAPDAAIDAPAEGDSGAPLRPCANSSQYGVCNWMLDAGDPHPLCRSCRLNLTIPDLSQPGHLDRWARVEQAKRRWLYTLLRLGLSPQPKQGPDDALGLGLHILAPQPGAEPVMTGHATGLITLNLDEADDVRREMARAAFGEPWRTLLGHLRHEGAHYLHHRWIAGDAAAADEFRAAFGDERADYGDALMRYHREGPPGDWASRYISAYASAHPHEDWAETCAHWLLVQDAVQTAGAWGLSLHSAAAQADPAQQPLQALPPDQLLLSQWLPVAQFLNAMNRSLGLSDSYPFLLPPAVVHKMGVVARLLGRAAAAGGAPANPANPANAAAPAPTVPDAGATAVPTPSPPSPTITNG